MHALDEAVGRTVEAITGPSDETDGRGDVEIRFSDGSGLTIYGVWCNDSTADTAWEWSETTRAVPTVDANHCTYEQWLAMGKPAAHTKAKESHGDA